MKTWHWSAVSLGMALLVSGKCVAQTALPHITALSQSGGQRGQKIDLTLTGVHIGQGTGIVVEGAGVTVESVTPEKAPANAPVNAEGKLLVRVAIAPDAMPGYRALRVLTPWGPSDVGHFVIGQWPETAEKEPNNSRDQAQAVTLPMTVIGRCDPADDVDWFRFSAHKGQTLLCDAFASRIGSALEPVLTVQDAAGHELALTQDFSQRDSSLVFTVPEDGDYFVSLHDLHYLGGGDRFYRLTLGEIPYLTGIFPPGGKPGTTQSVHLYGVNLGSDSMPLTLPSATLASDSLSQALILPKGVSNPVALALDDAVPWVQEVAAGHGAFAPLVAVPVTVYSRVSGTGGSNSPVANEYRFPGQQGQRLTLEVRAHSLDSRLTPVLTILDSSGKPLLTNDDSVGKDLQVDFTPPRTETYVARISDLNQEQGLDHVYRFTIRFPQPDFSLAFAPDCPIIPQGGTIPLVVTATRSNGFNGEIALEFTGLPEGVQVVGTPRIAEGQNEVTLLLSASAEAALRANALQVAGVATIHRKGMRHIARSTWEELVKQNDKIVTVVHPSLLPMASTGLPADFTLRTTTNTLTLSAGKTGQIVVQIIRKAGFNAKVPLSVLGLPPGVTADALEIAEKQSEAKITLKAAADARIGPATLIFLGRVVLDELHQRSFAALPVSLSLTK